MDRVLGWLFKQVEVTPTYHQQRCLATKASGCTVCADVCPHDAIRIRRRVDIDPVDCTGCGICVSACPSYALTPRGAPTPVDVALRCSEVKGNAPSVICLARLLPTDLLRLADPDGVVRLGRGDCAGCSIGGPEVPTVIAGQAEHASAIAEAVGRALRVEVEQVETLDVELQDRPMSRRDVLRSGSTGARRVTATALAPLERLAGDDPTATQRPELPSEWVDTLSVLDAAELERDALVPVRLPYVKDGCIFCPACTAVCPTDAIQRRFGDDGSTVLWLEPRRCVGCDACVGACPVHVVGMDEPVRWDRLDQDRSVLAERTAGGPIGTRHR